MAVKADTVLATLHQTLASYSNLIEAGDYSASERSSEVLLEFLSSTCDAIIVEDPENAEPQNLAVEILTHIHEFVTSPAMKQEIIDASAFWLPKVVARFACVSKRCLEVAEVVVDFFVGKCSPRDMLSSLCDAMASPIEPFMVPGYFLPLLHGLAKVIILIQRRQYEHIKTAVSVILKVLTSICFKSDDENTDFEMLVHRAICIANTIRTICAKLEGKDKKKLHALLGLSVLQIMALVSVGISEIPRCLALVQELSEFIQHCELSYLGLVTGCEVDMISKLVLGDDTGVDSDCFSQVNLGAALAVIWGFKASEVALAAKTDLNTVLIELHVNWTRRWEAVGMLKYLFLCAKLSWELKQDGIRFLLSIMDCIVSHVDSDYEEYSIHMPAMYTSLQAIETVIVYASDSVLRKDAFRAFRKMLSDIPTSGRFDVLIALIKSNDSSSMIGILIDCVKEEMQLEKTKRNSSAASGLNCESLQSSSFWNPSVLELVEMVLRPPKGGPPSLPEYSDAVSSALNLYRYVLISESTGNSNHTGILSKDKLQKAYSEWLLPLRTLVTGTVAENQQDYGDAMICALNPVELVLYRCIELVEDNLKHL